MIQKLLSYIYKYVILFYRDTTERIIMTLSSKCVLILDSDSNFNKFDLS